MAVRWRQGRVGVAPSSSYIEFSGKYYTNTLLPAGLPRSGNLPVLFLLSSQKSTFCPLAEKL